MSHLTLKGRTIDATCFKCGSRLIVSQSGLRCPECGLLKVRKTKRRMTV